MHYLGRLRIDNHDEEPTDDKEYQAGYEDERQAFAAMLRVYPGLLDEFRYEGKKRSGN